MGGARRRHDRPRRRLTVVFESLDYVYMPSRDVAADMAYFTDVLTKLVNLWPASRIDELMPWTWAAERSANKLAA